MSFDVEEVALRSGSTSDWASGSAPILAAGELGLDTDTNECRVGDGTNVWAALRSFTPKRTTVTLVAGTKVTADTNIRTASVILAVHKTLGTVTSAKALTITHINGTSFTITSTDNTDTSTLDVLIWY